MRLVAIACGVAVAASLVFGGTSRDGVPAIMVGIGATPLFVALLIEPQAFARGRAVLAPLVLVLAIPLLQLVPLPPMLWQILPGRAPIVETYAAAGLPLPWLAISIAPGATERSLLALVAPLAIFLGALACRREERRGLFGLVLLAGAGSALLEFLQIMDGPDSALRFYPPSDGSVGVGLFANRNHAAALLYCAIPIAAVALDPSRGRRPALRLAALAGFYLALVLGLMMTGSRSALILGAAAFVLTAALILRESLADLAGERRSALLASAGFVVVAILLAPAFGLTTILDRLTAQEAGAGDRASLARISFDAARSFFPFGSGLGTFERVFPLFQPREAIAPAVINHAHNDLLELTLETGLPGLLLIAGALALAMLCTLRNRREPDAGKRRERAAAAIALALLGAHSLLDYPLRMPALAAVFSLCAATLAGALDTVPKRERRRGESGWDGAARSGRLDEARASLETRARSTDHEAVPRRSSRRSRRESETVA